jgi:hypothetical protein
VRAQIGEPPDVVAQLGRRSTLTSTSTYSPRKRPSQPCVNDFLNFVSNPVSAQLHRLDLGTPANT